MQPSSVALRRSHVDSRRSPGIGRDGRRTDLETATEPEKRVLLDEMLSEVALCLDHLEVEVVGVRA